MVARAGRHEETECDKTEREGWGDNQNGEKERDRDRRGGEGRDTGLKDAQGSEGKSSGQEREIRGESGGGLSE